MWGDFQLKESEGGYRVSLVSGISGLVLIITSGYVSYFNGNWALPASVGIALVLFSAFIFLQTVEEGEAVQE